MRSVHTIPVSITALLFVMSPCSAADVEIKAFNSEPFGVGVLSLKHSDKANDPAAEITDGFLQRALLQLGDQALYPVVERKGTSQVNPYPAASRTVYFLFHPTDSLSVTTFDGDTHTVQPQPANEPHDQILERWWRLYTDRARRNAQRDLYPPEVDQYLTSMLARRLTLEPPDIRNQTYLPGDDISQMVGFLSGTESIRLAMQKDALLNSEGREINADRPLPNPTLPPAIEIPEPAADVVVEPIALAVPHECFYVRFGSYSNFIWFRDRVEQWGTDLRDLASARAIDYHISQRLQEQLEIRDTELSRLLGPTVIQDVAIIGSDTFIREGAGIGILFHAANNTLLSTNLRVQRSQRADAEPDVTLQTVQFDGHVNTGTLLSSPDHRVRSFYVVHGDFHLVTTSRTIARRFLDTTAKREDALGATKEFRYARTVTPLERNDSAFVYLSDAFFRSFVDPAMRIEMTRRASSENEMQLVQFAQLAAKAEGHRADSIESLIDGGFLPFAFGSRWDGSKLQIVDGQVIDTVRGARGSFVPVRDVPVTGATVSEVNAYAEFARMYRRIWTRMDPATVAISRRKDGERERLVMDLHVFPFPLQEFGLLRFLSPRKSSQRLMLPSKAFVLAEANIFTAEPLFIGVLDREHAFRIENDRVRMESERPEDAGLFIGARSPNGLAGIIGFDLEDFPKGETTQLDRPMLFYSGESWGRRSDDFGVVAHRQQDVDAVFDKLALAEAEREAQLRVHVGDLAGSKVAPILHAQAWLLAERSSRGNSEFLSQIASQFHIPPRESMWAAGHLIAGTPVCPLGGQYILMNADGERVSGEAAAVLSSTAGSLTWPEYRLPILERVHGAEFEMTAEGTTLTTHVELLFDVDE